jgi:hypothetical protein
LSLELGLIGLAFFNRLVDGFRRDFFKPYIVFWVFWAFLCSSVLQPIVIKAYFLEHLVCRGENTFFEVFLAGTRGTPCVFECVLWQLIDIIDWNTGREKSESAVLRSRIRVIPREDRMMDVVDAPLADTWNCQRFRTLPGMIFRNQKPFFEQRLC